MDAFKGATRTRGGLYMYSNQQGCDGGRLYYGISFICLFFLLFFLKKTNLNLNSVNFIID